MKLRRRPRRYSGARVRSADRRRRAFDEKAGWTGRSIGQWAQSPGCSVGAAATCPVAPRVGIRGCRLRSGSPGLSTTPGARVESSGARRRPRRCAVAIAEQAGVRTAGRITTTPDELERFAKDPRWSHPPRRDSVVRGDVGYGVGAGSPGEPRG